MSAVVEHASEQIVSMPIRFSELFASSLVAGRTEEKMQAMNRTSVSRGDYINVKLEQQSSCAIAMHLFLTFGEQFFVDFSFAFETPAFPNIATTFTVSLLSKNVMTNGKVRLHLKQVASHVSSYLAVLRI